MDPRTTGAWVVHHTNKLQQVKNQDGFFNILIAGKTGRVLSAIAETDEAELSRKRVQSLASANGVNPLELDTILGNLANRQLIEFDDVNVRVIGVTTASVLQHTAAFLEDLDVAPEERAAIDLSEETSGRPMERADLIERLSDEHALSAKQVAELLVEAEQIGFVDAETIDEGKLYFNGNLFRRGGLKKTQKVLATLTQDEERRLKALDAELLQKGCLSLTEAERILTTPLLDKCHAIGLFDVHGVENEFGTTLFVTRPASFGKFSDPFHDDALDMAKALVACLTYGITQRDVKDGRISMPQALIRKLISGAEIGGRAPAIGRDYQALEYKGVVRVRRVGTDHYYMRLLKKDIGQLALAVLTSGDASHESVIHFPSATVNKYVAPEDTRPGARDRTRMNDNHRSNRSAENFLRALREA